MFFCHYCLDNCISLRFYHLQSDGTTLIESKFSVDRNKLQRRAEGEFIINMNAGDKLKVYGLQASGGIISTLDTTTCGGDGGVYLNGIKLN